MRFYTFEIIIEKESGEQAYTAYTPTLAGCFCRGKTLDEARRSIHAAIQAEVASLLAGGRPIGRSERVVHVAELTVAVPEAGDGCRSIAIETQSVRAWRARTDRVPTTRSTNTGEQS